MTWEEYVKYLKANSSPETIACIEEAHQPAAGALLLCILGVSPPGPG